MAVQNTRADAVSVLATDTWSGTSSGSDGNASLSSSSNLTFDLSPIPAGSTIISATLIILDTTTTWNINGFDNGAPPISPLTFFGEANGNSDIFGDEYLDSFNIDGAAPNGTGVPPFLDLLFAPETGPFPLDPSAITPHGIYAVPIEGGGLMQFVGFDPGNSQQSGTPLTPSFTMNAVVDGELDVQFSTTPEPAYTGLLALLFIPLVGIAAKRNRA